MTNVAHDTLPKYMLSHCMKWGDKRVAMRNKEFGIWKGYTWQDYYEHVKYFALGLKSLGFERGNKVCILGDNEPQWYWAEYATQSLRGAAIGIYVDSIPSEVKYIVVHSESTFIVARDQEQVDKILEIRDEIPLVRKVIYWDEKGMWGYKDPYIISFEQVMDLGKEYDKSHADAFESSIKEGQPDDVSVLCYTSGTTGLPKGVEITNAAIVQAIDDWMKVLPWYPGENYLSYLSPAWITEQGYGMGAGLVSGVVINFPEEPETLEQDVREIGPTRILYTSRLWENLSSTIFSKIDDSSFIKRNLFYLFLPVGQKIARLAAQQKEPGLFYKILYKIGDAVVFHQLRDKLGLAKTSICMTGGAPTSPDVFSFLYAVGIKLRQVYGSSEALYCCCHVGDDIRFDTLGTLLPGVEARITADGEMLWRRRGGIFRDYYKQPEKTVEVMLGTWFRSGDAGNINEDGHIVYLDRVAEMMELSSGEKYPPQYIENRLKFSKYIRDCILLGGQERPFVGVIVIVDFDIVSRWAERRHLNYTTFTDLSQKPEVYALVEKEIKLVNRNLPEAARVKKFTLLPKELDPDEAELTRTRKLRRAFVENKFAGIISIVYGGGKEYHFDEEVKYRDGRTGKISTFIRIVDIA